MTEGKKRQKTGSTLKPMTNPKSRSGADSQRATGAAASQLIDERIRSLDGWRGETLARARRMILEADPDIVEEWKWMGTPVWSHAGNVCTGEAYKQVIKLTFARGAFLEDPENLFNSSLEGNMRRAIDIREGTFPDEVSFKALIRAAVAENLRCTAARTKSATATAKPDKAQERGTVALLSGGNPQIAKADGDAAVQAYIGAMPGWKRDVGERLDELIERAVPEVRKAVKWNSPFYGVEGQGWFLSFHVFTRYVKVTFFAGSSLKPAPPGFTPKSGAARWIDIHEGDGFDEKQMATWVKQAVKLPGWMAK